MLINTTPMMRKITEKSIYQSIFNMLHKSGHQPPKNYQEDDPQSTARGTPNHEIKSFIHVDGLY